MPAVMLRKNIIFFSVFQHAIGSDANCCSFDPEVYGSEAASSLKLYHNRDCDQSNSEELTSIH
jgi:hypothetical protein